MAAINNTFGHLFRITTFGESHGAAVGVVIDGCPAGLEIKLEDISHELKRRAPGQSKLVSPRKETEEFEILSGVFEGKTTGSSILFIVRNLDARSKDYEELKNVFRPGHADFAYFCKYGHCDYRGGGRASARETVGRVIGGAVAKQLLAKLNVHIRGGVVQIGNIHANQYVWEQVESNVVRSVDPDTVDVMTGIIEDARHDGDSVGGIVEVQAQGVPVGLGEPVFGKLDAAIAGALMSMPAVKGVEIGDGFSLAAMRGSQANDQMSKSGFLTNHHGGTLGGISTGAMIIARAALKPPPSIRLAQKTINTSFEEQEISTTGRHDPCVAPRAVSIAEAMLALVIVDFWLQDKARKVA